MPLKYKVNSRNHPDKEIYITAHKVTEALTFKEYLKEVNDPATTHCLDLDTNLWAFHAPRNYENVEKHYNVYRIDTGEIRLLNKEHTINVGDYVRYDVGVDELRSFDLNWANSQPNLQLVE